MYLEYLRVQKALLAIYIIRNGSEKQFSIPLLPQLVFIEGYDYIELCKLSSFAYVS